MPQIRADLFKSIVSKSDLDKSMDQQSFVEKLRRARH